MLEQFLPLFCVAFAVLGALAKFAQDMLDNDNYDFHFKKLFLHVIVSIFASLLVLIVGYSYKLSYLVIIASCGMAGWSGSQAIVFIKRLITRDIDKNGKT